MTEYQEFIQSKAFQKLNMGIDAVSISGFRGTGKPRLVLKSG